MGREGSQASADSTSIRLAVSTAAPARARGAVTRWAQQSGLEEALTLDLRLLVTELVTNAVRHAELEPWDEIELGVECGESSVRVRVHDAGAGFEEYLPIPSGDDISGRGLYLVHQLASAWGVEPGSPFGIWFELARR